MTEAIDEMIGAVEGYDPALLAALDEDDKRDAFERAVDLGNPQAASALAILARADPGPEGFLAIAAGQIIASESSPAEAMVTALSFAAAAGPTIFPILVGVAGAAQDPLVALAAWRSLQQIAKGEEAEMEELQAIAPSPGDVVGNQAAFAISLIACRAGRAGFEPPVPGEDEFLAIERDEEPLYAIAQEAATEADIELLEQIPSGERYLVVPVTSSASVITCGENGENQTLLCLDSDIQEFSPETLLRGPAMPGLLLHKHREGLGLSVRYLPITWPDEEGGFHLAVYEPDGAQVYYGHARGEEVNESEANVGVFFALNQPGVERLALNLSISSSGVTLTGELLAASEIATDRLEPEAN
ncbi:MAG TPA: hypothetical protein VFI17_09805 [Solirubrobacterales bacterium]|nr:hypothetical protein [Solirubrobacterales bacterium]